MRFRAGVLGPRSLSWLGFSFLSQQDKIDSLQTSALRLTAPPSPFPSITGKERLAFWLRALSDSVHTFLQHHHDHFLHASGPGVDAPLPLDLQPGLDQYPSGAAAPARGSHPDSLQHAHSYWAGCLHSVQIQSGSRLHREGKVSLPCQRHLPRVWSLKRSCHARRFGQQGREQRTFRHTLDKFIRQA